MQVVHTARLRSASKASSPNADFNSVPLGQGVPMELIISHTRGWDYEKDTETEGLALEFCFEVQANSDVWLIGGKRKGYFSAKVMKAGGIYIGCVTNVKSRKARF